ncbi:MAG: hypothetical protein AAFQ82_18470, partial [Myxococcota bacterium]
MRNDHTSPRAPHSALLDRVIIALEQIVDVNVEAEPELKADHYVRALERTLAKELDVPSLHAVTNGTQALDLTLRS